MHEENAILLLSLLKLSALTPMILDYYTSEFPLFLKEFFTPGLLSLSRKLVFWILRDIKVNVDGASNILTAQISDLLSSSELSSLLLHPHFPRKTEILYNNCSTLAKTGGKSVDTYTLAKAGWGAWSFLFCKCQWKWVLKAQSKKFSLGEK